jgi:hypothetical protein
MWTGWFVGWWGKLVSFEEVVAGENINKVNEEVVGEN